MSNHDTSVILHRDRLGLVWAWIKGDPFGAAYYTREAAIAEEPDTTLPDFAASMRNDRHASLPAEPTEADLMPFTEDSLMRAVRSFYLQYGEPHERAAYASDLPYLTVGTVLDLLGDLPRDTPITGWAEEIAHPGGALTERYVNVSLTREDVTMFTDGEQPSVILSLHDNFDTRQW